MDRIKIYLDTLVFGLQRIGGVSVVWYEYIKRMLKDEDIELTLLDIESDYINVLFKKLDTTKANHIKESGKNLQLLRNKNPKLYSIHGNSIFQSTYLRTSGTKNVKNVIMIHDITHQLYFNGVKRILNTFQKRKAIKKADGIIYISENTKKNVEKYFPESKQKLSSIIYNSASEVYKPVKDAVLPKKYCVLQGRKYFLYVGDRFQYKNTNILFDLLEKRNDLTAVFVGGRTFSRTELEKQEKYNDRCFHFKRVSDEELNVLYNLAFCFIYPSLYEGFGIPVLEAMKCGCPVIAFNNSSIPEVLRNTGILLDNNDAIGILDSVEILNDNTKRQAIVQKEIEAAKFFSWDKSYAKLKDFYRLVQNGSHLMGGGVK